MQTIDSAQLTSFNKGRVRATPGAGVPRDWMTGAAHDDRGNLVDISQRQWAGDRSAPVAVDAAIVRTPPKARRLEGHWLYGGHWTGHFGHFFLEVLTTLWAEHPPVDGLVFHRSFRGSPPMRNRDHLSTPPLTTWQQDLLRLAGYDGVPVRVVRHRPIVLDRLTVASRPVLLKAWAAPEAVEVWRRISSQVGTSSQSRKVFLSRSSFNTKGASSRASSPDPEWDRFLDATFDSHGFTVIHPETLPIEEQIAVVRGAEVLAGSAGSALHLSAFAGDHRLKVLEVGDNRSVDRAMPTQHMIDAACGHHTMFVAYQDRRGLARALKRA